MRSAGETSAPDTAEEEARLQKRLDSIRRKIIVLSGKGGVGKSTVAANLALSLARSGTATGLLDIDLHGPSVPVMLGLAGTRLHQEDGLIVPARLGSLKVMSIGLLIAESDQAVVWRGPLKHTAIRQFLADVAWGELEYLVIDSPPGTGDEALSILHLIGSTDGAVIVTTPQRLAVADVRRCITFCRMLSLDILGVVENMSGFVCPRCSGTVDIFKTGGGEEMAENMDVPFLGTIPLDPAVVAAADEGRPLGSATGCEVTGKSFRCIAEKVKRYFQSTHAEKTKGDVT